MKKNSTKILQILLILAISFPLTILSQVEVAWTKNFSNTIKWQEVTALGNLIISSNDALFNVNTENGNIIWSKAEHANLSRDFYEELPNSPFFSIENNNKVYLIDQFSGDEVFNSSKVGIDKVDDYFVLYDSDAILVAGKNANGDPLLVMVKMSDGSLAWSMDEKFDRIISVTELDNNELLMVTLFNNYKLNKNTGAILWKKTTSKEAEQVNKLSGALAQLVKTAANNMTDMLDIQLEFFRNPKKDVFYLGSQQERQIGTSSGNPIMKYTNNYMAYNISDGSLVWDKDLEVKGMLSHVVFNEKGLIVLPDDGNRTKINLFDFKTKEGKWGKKGRGIKIKGGIYDYMKTDDGILLVSQTSSNNFLNYLDPRAGVITFDKPVKVKGNVLGIIPLKNNILYVTSETMNILDQRKGVLKWKKNIQTNPSLTAEYNGKIYVYDFRSGTIKTVDKDTEQVEELSTTAISFEGKEIPRRLEIMEDGVFLSSDQNLAKINFDGTVQYVKHYEAPRESGLKRALLFAVAARATLISAQSHLIAGSVAKVQRDVASKSAATASATGQISNAYSNLGTVASAYAGSAFRRANARLTATKSGRDFMFVMSSKDKNVVLLKVSKLTGEIEGEIDLGKNRKPNYALDDVTGQVYYLTENNQITSYQVK